MDLPSAAILFAFVAASGFFSLSSAVFGTMRKSRLRTAGKGILEAVENPDPLIFSLRIWNLLDRVAAGILAARFFPGPALLPGAAGLALAFIAFSEALPRLIARLCPEVIFRVVFPVLAVLALPWKPLYLFVLAPFFKSSASRGDEEFRMALEEGEKTGAVESEERSMVEGVLYLGDRPVSAFMTHRSEIEWLDIDAGPKEVREKVLAFRAQSFFPVIRKTQDDIAGVASVEDILIALTGAWKGLQGVMKKPRFIPETLSALKAFEAFKGQDEYYLCVMDEYGGFAGSLEVRDLIGEIVGGLSAPEEEEILAQEDGTWLAGGSVNMDDVAEVPGLEELAEKLLEEKPQDYRTLAGLILKLAGEIPRTGASFEWENYRFKVLDLDGNRIDKVLISKIPGER